MVGGAVRDELLGLPVRDRDYVVVGASPEQMIRLGFRPVGRDFPVFLHPQTQEEYALARTERKSGRGYHGFTFYTAPTVTLHEDLQRRDLTINAMAISQDGQLIDLFGGQADLAAGILRHVSPAFTEDPVRILRIARFAARFELDTLAGFNIAPETDKLLRAMVTAGELSALAQERIWQEIAQGLLEKHPARMLQTLRAVGALAVVFPELDQVFGKMLKAPAVEQEAGAAICMALTKSALESLDLVERFSLLFWGIANASDDDSHTLLSGISTRLRLPKELGATAKLLLTITKNLPGLTSASPESLLDFLYRIDAWRKPERLVFFNKLLPIGAKAFGWPDHDWRLSWQNLNRALIRSQAVDLPNILAATPDIQVNQMGAAVYAARLRAINGC